MFTGPEHTAGAQRVQASVERVSRVLPPTPRCGLGTCGPDSGFSVHVFGPFSCVLGPERALKCQALQCKKIMAPSFFELEGWGHVNQSLAAMRTCPCSKTWSGVSLGHT